MEPIGLDAAPQLQRLFERCTEFWELTEGCPPPPDAAVKELTFLAPGKADDDRFTFGVYDGGALIAFAHLIRDYPKPSEWWIAVLLIDPSRRGSGLGAKIHRQIVDWIEARGAATLGIAVLAQNVAALRFWSRIGYIEGERQKYTGVGGLQSEVVLMSLPVATT